MLCFSLLISLIEMYTICLKISQKQIILTEKKQKKKLKDIIIKNLF